MKLSDRHAQHHLDLYDAVLDVRNASREAGDEIVKRHLDLVSPLLAAKLGVLIAVFDFAEANPHDKRDHLMPTRVTPDAPLEEVEPHEVAPEVVEHERRHTAETERKQAKATKKAEAETERTSDLTPSTFGSEGWTKPI